MLRIHAWLEQAQVDARMIMQVHDELVFEVKEADLRQLREKVVELMSAAAELSVPLTVAVGAGQNWDEAH